MTLLSSFVFFVDIFLRVFHEIHETDQKEINEPSVVFPESCGAAAEVICCFSFH